VIDHHRQVRQLLRERRRVLQVLDVEEQVERDLVLLEDLEAPDDVVADDEVVVGLALRDVADADELLLGLELDDLLLALGAREVDPADDAQDEGVLLREVEDPAVLAEVVLGLDEDRAVDAALRSSGARSSGR
jgi:hypothetical protein